MHTANLQISSAQKKLLLLSLLTLTLLGGCKTTQQKTIQLTPAQIQLDAGKTNFQNGEYGLAEKSFLNNEIWQDDKSAQIESLKYLAFIYCVTDRVTLCRHSFYQALQLDPSFELSSAESTHPLWGPEFLVAQSGLGKN